jgi:hypothetical protein
MAAKKYAKKPAKPARKTKGNLKPNPGTCESCGGSMKNGTCSRCGMKVG